MENQKAKIITGIIILFAVLSLCVVISIIQFNLLPSTKTDTTVSTLKQEEQPFPKIKQLDSCKEIIEKFYCGGDGYCIDQEKLGVRDCM